MTSQIQAAILLATATWGTSALAQGIAAMVATPELICTYDLDICPEERVTVKAARAASQTDITLTVGTDKFCQSVLNSSSDKVTFTFLCADTGDLVTVTVKPKTGKEWKQVMNCFQMEVHGA